MTPEIKQAIRDRYRKLTEKHGPTLTAETVEQLCDALDERDRLLRASLKWLEQHEFCQVADDLASCAHCDHVQPNHDEDCRLVGFMAQIRAVLGEEKP